MPGRLRRFAPSVLGLVGSSIGLVYSYGLLSYNGDGCSCNWSSIQAFLGWPVMVGSMMGLAGCTLYLFARRAGGVLLLLGGIVASPLPFFIGIGYWPSLALFSSFGLFIAPSFLGGLLLFFGGLLCFRRTRQLIKALHDGGRIP